MQDQRNYAAAEDGGVQTEFRRIRVYRLPSAAVCAPGMAWSVSCRPGVCCAAVRPQRCLFSQGHVSPHLGLLAAR